ncbi:hypothetical protein [Agaribacterium haliotis]|uniref:hypothetical protein n=1 Tax=Agaribacterium haliotis TaxID=2013869 RepID=UPI0013045FB4|nr:hypothetical protein [Agaribacterium haliotis]
MSRLFVLLVFCFGLSSCSQPQVYGSITMSKGFNSYGGGYRGSGGYGSITIGGRIR